jgi:lactoylglutathione lyase
MKAEDLYHTGIVVEDFDATMALLAETAGYRWCEEYRGDQVIQTPEGQATIEMRIVYSVTEPRLEILQAVPGTVWTPSSSGVHHLGYWSDDVSADGAALAARGLRLEVTAPAPDGSALWAYYKGASGPRIELVSRMLEPMLREWFTGAMPEA